MAVRQAIQLPKRIVGRPAQPMQAPSRKLGEGEVFSIASSRFIYPKKQIGARVTASPDVVKMGASSAAAPRVNSLKRRRSVKPAVSVKCSAWAACTSGRREAADDARRNDLAFRTTS